MEIYLVGISGKILIFVLCFTESHLQPGQAVGATLGRHIAWWPRTPFSIRQIGHLSPKREDRASPLLPFPPLNPRTLSYPPPPPPSLRLISSFLLAPLLPLLCLPTRNRSLRFLPKTSTFKKSTIHLRLQVAVANIMDASYMFL